ncbi:phosphatidate cytidylyltransferase [Uliginosibacterium sp. H1]|uniref:phosphatidate cytidylyltransferase n=1 Tax=Uliginosibacterium sp. H1 TaxID=3114757 RepID=UPI002E176986|nr:phosphatidate cytidylyltransferase [Uliginosibacterium sp. H1]
MLKQRVLTAIIMVAVFAAALFLLPNWAWGVFVAAIVWVAGSEWRRLAGLSDTVGTLLSAVLTVFAVVAAVWPTLLAWQVVLAVGLAFWLLWVPALMRPGAAPLAQGSKKIWLGLLVLLPAAVAMVLIRNQHGPWMLLYGMLAVWIADTAAYFVGRAIGRRKLAPRISPGKSWEGAIGGAVAVLVYALVLRQIEPALGQRGSVLAFAVLAIGYAALSVLGDLFESLAKRQAGMKDSGTLLPGHGGVLDRVDSLTSTLPLLGLLLLL